MKKVNPKLFALMATGLVVGLVLVGAGCGDPNTDTNSTTTPTTTTTSDDYSTLVNKDYGYEIQYPNNWTYELSGGADGEGYATVVIGNPISGQQTYTMTIDVQEILMVILPKNGQTKSMIIPMPTDRRQ